MYLRSPRLAALLTLSLGLGAALAAEHAQKAPEETPIQAMERTLGELEKQKKSVDELRQELEALRPGWSEIDRLRGELEAKVKVFAPKVEAWMRKAQSLGAPGPGGSPIAGLQGGLDQLAGRGLKTAALQKELDKLKPDWEAIAALQAKLTSGSGSEAQAFRPKIEALMQRVHTAAEKLGSDPKQGG